MTLSGTPASILATCEIATLCLGAFALFRRWGNSVSEACAYALIIPLMLLSAIFQLAFLAGIPWLAMAVEAGLTAAAVFVIYRLRAGVGEALTAGRVLIAAHPVSGICAAALVLYLLLSGFLLPPQPLHWPSLTTVLSLQNKGSVTAALSSALPAAAGAPLPPLNAVILPHLFLRFHTDLGIGLFGFMAFLSIGFSTYALARRYAWPPTAFTVALMVVAMPRVALLATSPALELLPAAVALFCLLAVYRAIEHPNRRDLCLLICGLLFTISGSPMDAAFPAVMIPLSALLLFRRHGFITWWNLLISRLWLLPLAMAAFVLFSQLWLAMLNHAHHGQWFVSAEPIPFFFNADGIQGALANLARYLFSSAHFTRPFDLICSWTFGFTVSGALQQVYDGILAPLLGNLGASAPFAIRWLPDQRVAWFGPLGFLLVMPAVVFAAIRAPRRLKAIAVGLVGYFFLMVLIAAWCPANVRFFTLFFVCSGFTLALFLPPWYVSPAGRRRLQEISILLLLYAAVFNLMQPAVSVPALATGPSPDAGSCGPSAHAVGCKAPALPEKSAWLASEWGRNRQEPSFRLFGDRRVAEIAALLPPTAPLHLVCRRPQTAYPFLMIFPQAVVLDADAKSHQAVRKNTKPAEIIILFTDFDPLLPDPAEGLEVLWQADPSSALCGGKLIRLGNSGIQ